MPQIPGFRLDITGASGSLGSLSPRDGYRCFVLPRGGFAAQDSTGTKITFDSASVASRFAVGNWIQSGLLTANIRQVGAVGGNSLTVSGAALTVTTNDRIYLIGNTEPTVNGGSATYTTPNTIVRQRDDDAATVYANSMLITNTDGMVQGFAVTALYDLLIQDSNVANQGSLIDLPVGVPEGISVSDAAIFGSTLIVNGWAVFGSTVTMNNTLGVTGPAVFGATLTVSGGFSGTAVIPRLGQRSTPTSGGAFRFIDGNVFPLTVVGVQAALDECESSGGGVVYVPSNAGITITTVSVKIGTGCTLEGTGPQATTTPTFTGSSSTSVSAMIENKHQDGTQQTGEIRNLWLFGNSVSGASAGSGIYLKRLFSGSVIDNVRITSVRGNGLQIDGTTVFSTGPYRVQRLVVADCAIGDCIVVNEGSRGIWLDSIEADRPGPGKACVRLTATADSSAQSRNVTIRNIYSEFSNATQIGIIINNVANVLIDGYEILNNSGVSFTAVIQKTGSGIFGGGASGLTVRNVSGNFTNDQVQISDQVCGVTVTGGADASFPIQFLDMYSCPVSAGSNGRQSMGQIIGVQYQKKGTAIAAASNITPREGNLFEVTGTTDIQTIAASAVDSGRLLTLIWTNAAPGKLGTAGNVRLAGGATFSPVQWDAITLACTGTTWFEAAPR